MTRSFHQNPGAVQETTFAKIHAANLRLVQAQNHPQSGETTPSPLLKITPYPMSQKARNPPGLVQPQQMQSSLLWQNLLLAVS